MSNIILHPTEPPRQGMVRQKTLFPVTNKFAIKLPMNLETFVPPFGQIMDPELHDGDQALLTQHHLVEWTDLAVSAVIRRHSFVYSQIHERNWNLHLRPVRVSLSEFTPPTGRIPYNVINHDTSAVAISVFNTVNKVLTVPEHASAFSLQAYNLFLPFNGRTMGATASLVGTHDIFSIVAGEASIEYFGGGSTRSAFWVSTSLDSHMRETHGERFKIFSVTFSPL